MKQITVKASEVQGAIERAKTLSGDWQAGCLEILLLPQVYARWQELNAERYPGVVIERHEGAPHVGFTREDNLAVEDWTAIAGYALGYGFEGYAWNRARSNHYGHSPATTWDGVQRETVCAFVDALRMLALEAAGDLEIARERLEPALERAGIDFVDDLDADLFTLYKQGWAGSTDWYKRATKLSRKRARYQVNLEQGRPFHGDNPLALVPYARDLPDVFKTLPESAERIGDEPTNAF